MIRRVEVEGEAFERGRQYGARTSDAIQQNVEGYLRLIQYHTGRGRVAALQAATEYEPILKAYVPRLLLEMKGIADGAGSDLADILLLNARSELVLGASECTSLAAAPEASVERKTLLGQNWDWSTVIRPDPILLHIRQAGSPSISTIVEAGQVAKIGMNSAGLGVCLNFLEHGHRGVGLPIHVILRTMLDSASLGDALHAAYNVPRGGSANVLVAHARGEIIDIELTPTDADFLYGDEGWLVHANHFESQRLRAGDAGIKTSRSTLARAARARRLMASARGKISPDTLRQILTDHAYGDYAICRHPRASEPPLQQSVTRASIIMDLAQKKMLVATGNPCEVPYMPVTVQV